MTPRRHAMLLAFAALCAVAVIDVTLLGGSGKYRRGIGTSVSVGDCVTIQEKRTACGDSDAWYRVSKERPASDGCSSPRRRSEDGRYCLMPLASVKVDIQLPKIDLSTPTPSRRYGVGFVKWAGGFWRVGACWVVVVRGAGGGRAARALQADMRGLVTS